MQLAVGVRISIQCYLWSSDLHRSIGLAFVPRLLCDSSADRSDLLFLFTPCQRNVKDSFFNYYTNLKGRWILEIKLWRQKNRIRKNQLNGFILPSLYEFFLFELFSLLPTLPSSPRDFHHYCRNEEHLQLYLYMVMINFC